jgi:hypothetical protein
VRKIVVFPSVSYAISGESALKGEGIEHEVIPVAPYVNHGCGIGIRIGENLLEKTLKCFQSKKVKYEVIVDSK